MSLKEDEQEIHLIPNLLTPEVVTVIPKKEIEERIASKLSSMPQGMADVLTKEQILDLLEFLRQGGYQLPPTLEHGNH